jgi:hypothetical protein
LHYPKSRSGLDLGLEFIGLRRGLGLRIRVRVRVRVRAVLNIAFLMDIYFFILSQDEFL